MWSLGRLVVAFFVKARTSHFRDLPVVVLFLTPHIALLSRSSLYAFGLACLAYEISADQIKISPSNTRFSPRSNQSMAEPRDNRLAGAETLSAMSTPSVHRQLRPSCAV